MMLHIPEVLTKAQVAELRRAIDAADWVDGNATSGTQSALAKRNEQLPEGSEAARYAGEKILDVPIYGSVKEAAAETGAAVVAVPVKDTIKLADAAGGVKQTLDRSSLWQVQTPQTFRRELLLKAHEQAAAAGVVATDDAALVEWAGGSVSLVRGTYYNFKVTTPEDLVLAEAVAAERSGRRMQRVGFGYDVHQFVAGRPLMLGGVEVQHDRGLEGHSDADVLLHAISDALLGAAGLGDIGKHFPDTDPRYKGISSLLLLREVCRKLKEAGYTAQNLDAVIAAQEPKLAPYIARMNETIAAALDIPVTQVNVKATTTEHLGFVGRKEGIAAQAVVMIG